MPAGPDPRSDPWIGAALERGFLTPTQLSEAQQLEARLRAEGRSPGLHRVLGQRYLSSGQVAALREQLGSRRVPRLNSSGSDRVPAQDSRAGFAPPSRAPPGAPPGTHPSTGRHAQGPPASHRYDPLEASGQRNVHASGFGRPAPASGRHDPLEASGQRNVHASGFGRPAPASGRHDPLEASGQRYAGYAARPDPLEASGQRNVHASGFGRPAPASGRHDPLEASGQRYAAHPARQPDPLEASGQRNLRGGFSVPPAVPLPDDLLDTEIAAPLDPAQAKLGANDPTLVGNFSTSGSGDDDPTVIGDFRTSGAGEKQPAGPYDETLVAPPGWHEETMRAPAGWHAQTLAAPAPEPVARTLAAPLASSLAASVPGRPAAPGADPWQPGSHFAGFIIERLLGRGGMGAVYLGRDTQGQQRAIKMLAPGADANSVERFRREGLAQAAVGEHPHVLKVHHAGIYQDTLYLVMDVAPGGDLSARLQMGALDFDAALELGLALSDGLAHCHAAGILHRDLKPANVMFDAEGRPLLVDFGIARLAREGTLTNTGDLLGSPAYMSPEQAAAIPKETDERTDVYGMGAILYEALTGAPPFNGRSLTEVLKKVLFEPPTPPTSRVPALPRDADRVVLKALAKEPTDRYPSARAFHEDLARLASGRKVEGRALDHARRRRRRAKRVLAVLLAVLALVGGVQLAWAVLPEDEALASFVPAELALAPLIPRSTTILDRVHLQGSVEGTPAAVGLLVNGRPQVAPAAWSSFEQVVPLPHPGPYELVLFAIDPDGTRHEVSWRVTRRYEVAPPLDLKGLRFRPESEDFVNEKDGSILVWIPPGSFDMGSEDSRLVANFKGDDVLLSRPVQPGVRVRGFFLGKYELSAAQFQRFVAETQCKEETNIPASPEHPIKTTWAGAAAYCAWADCELPSEAQWEYAGRSSDNRLFPWGNEPPPTERPDGEYPVTVAHDGEGPFGCVNMIGNVVEWTLDDLCLGYTTDRKTALPPFRRDDFMNMGKVVRSPGWDEPPGKLQLAFRTSFLVTDGAAGGLRLCRNPPAPPEEESPADPDGD